MNEKNLVKILAAAAVILMIVFISLFCIDTHESTSLTVKSQDTLKDGDAYSVELCDSKGNPIANQDISISFGSNSFNVTTDENGIAILKINNVPAGEYEVKIQYNGNIHYKNTSAVHHAVISEIEKTRSLDEILQSGEYKKKIGDYRIVEYGYMGDMELALVEDSNGKKWIMGGDGFCLKKLDSTSPFFQSYQQHFCLLQLICTVCLCGHLH